ncbi:response regulator transcription factor [Acidobacteria bacterium ACD]|nr:MAG: DNA-binding response regulator [Acidobacteriota bacterium]MDL1948349.1 response regulator transcription factor [Acidobacteria bacterium ACD]
MSGADSASPRVFTAVVVDDEPLARELLAELLSRRPDVRVLATCADGFEAVRAVSEKAPDLLFLDVQMPELDGFEVLELLERKPAVVFVTAYDQYAVKAFEVHAVDYLLKPYGAARLDEAVERAKARAEGTRAAPADGAVDSARPPGPARRVVVRDGARVAVIPVGDLEWAEAQDDYVLLSTRGRRYLKQQTLSGLAARLDPARFVRVHRSYLLNLDRLVRLRPGGRGAYTAVLSDGTELPVSRSGAQRLRDRLSVPS